MSASFVLSLSLILQFLAVYFALRLIKLTGKSLAWSLIAAAIALMALRRGITLFHLFGIDSTVQPDLFTELIALTISALMAIGIERITPLFASLRSASEQLRESEIRYRTMFENSPISIWEEDFSAIREFFDRLRRDGITDFDAYLDEHPEMLQQLAERVRIVDVNQATLTLHGASSKEELLSGIVQTFTSDAFATFREELLCLWQGGTQMSRYSVIKTLAGEPRYVSVNFAIRPGHEKTLSRGYVSLIDITERQHAEQALKLREHEFRTLVEHSPDFIVRYNTDLQRVYVNPAWEKASGLVADEVVGVPVEQIPRVPQPVVSEYYAALKLALETGTRQSVDFSWGNALGETLYLQSVILPEFDQEGQVINLLSIGRDLTGLRQAEQERRLHIQFLASMDRINRAIQASENLDSMMRDVLDEVLDILDCDRASLLYPCDPDSPSWRVPMERARPGCEGISATGEELPMTPELAAMHRASLQSRHPVAVGPGTDFPIPAKIQEYGDKSGLGMTLYPKTGNPWS
ncbi:MAG: PAS domain-containing protein, partial [Candidatus Thiodiazotropha sp.]